MKPTKPRGEKKPCENCKKPCLYFEVREECRVCDGTGKDNGTLDEFNQPDTCINCLGEGERVDGGYFCDYSCYSNKLEEHALEEI